MLLKDRISEAIATIQPHLGQRPDIALILGTCHGDLAQHIHQTFSIDYGDIPHFKATGVPGHAGKLIVGQLGGQQVVCMQGRLHAYEGNTPQEVVFPLQVMHALGAQTLILTNAAGGINQDFDAGDIMLITDHINFTGANPLTLGNGLSLLDFPDMCYAYTPALRAKAQKAATACGITVKQGVYLGVRGPNIETPAEIRAFRTWGADAVGMSTVFEVLTAVSLGMDVLGFSLITNKAAGILDKSIKVEEVLLAATATAKQVEILLLELLNNWATS